MQKAPVLKGSGLKPLEESKSSEEVHVFGRNLEERVITHKEDDKPAELSFAAPQAEPSQSEDDIESIKKRKFDAITGEEDEETVFQGDFKLFVWDTEGSNWMEKGRGQLKLNDSIEDETTKSRLIMRISGTLRIILNVAIKQSTFKIITSSKTSIRFTDSLTVWAVSGSNVQQLRGLIEERLPKSGDAIEESRDPTGQSCDETGESGDASEDSADAAGESENATIESGNADEESDDATEEPTKKPKTDE